MTARFATVLVALVLAASMSVTAGCTGTPTSAQPGGWTPAQPAEGALTNGEISTFLALDIDSENASRGDEPIYDLEKTVDEAIRIARVKPDSAFRDTEGAPTPRQALGDAAADLAKANPKLSKKLELALETLPQQK